MPSHPKPKTVKDVAYLQWVRTRMCHLGDHGDCLPHDTMGKGFSEAAHTQGKSRDDLAYPLCGGHHRTGPHSWHRGSKTHQWHYRYDAVEVAKNYYALYQESK